MDSFLFQPIFEQGPDSTVYRKLNLDGVSVEKFGNREILNIAPQTLSKLAEIAFDDVSHLLRTSHLEKLQHILKDPESSPNDIYVASELLKNAVIASHRVFPSCQDTGTALIMAKKGESVYTGADDSAALSKGIFDIFKSRNLRYSQLAPLSFYEEKNTGNNLPAQIEIFANAGDSYEFLFIAKGGGSANKSYLYQKTKSLLNPASFEEFILEAVTKLGTAACPPYHLAVVVGGTSAEMNLKTAKLASCGYYDNISKSGNASGRAFRDTEMEAKIETLARATKIGAQFGGKYFVHDVRVIRLPRHGASCPVGIAVSCSADRQIKAKITKEGVFLEALETDPHRFLVGNPHVVGVQEVVLNLNQPMSSIRKVLSTLPVSTRVMLTGKLIVARDIAHAKLVNILREGKPLPEYFKNHPIYYAGPAKTPEGHPSGSFGPTTAERMDPYVAEFMAAGASLVMLGKGNRSEAVRLACQTYGGFYLGSIGGPAARLGQDCIKAVKVVDFAELGMEAVMEIEVENFPAFVVTDDKGNDFFARIENKAKS